MDSTRANEILQAKETIDVVYNGNPVWINSVSDKTATVHPVGQHQQKFDVPVTQLQEKTQERIG